ncbi:MAG: hypothetical protein QXL94_00100 [Candidatus Parvarchaeum sp.]
MPDATEILDSIVDRLSEKLYDFNVEDARFAVKHNIPLWKDGIEEFKKNNKIFFGALKTGAILYWNDIEKRLVNMTEVESIIKKKNPDLLQVPGIRAYMESQIKSFYNALYDYLFEH